ncbi:MAG TPA: VOC family protein [Pyrinomonadaceae bacterium]|nr:VOC family protein [Pyrinomonadaceae bacterium]
MSKLNIYLNFPGTAEEAFNFYRSIFGGDFAAVMRWEHAPDDCGDTSALSEAEKKAIMHIALPIGDGNVLMGADWVGEMGGQLNQGNNFSISYNTHSKDEADRVFNALSEGGNIIMPMADMFWGSYWGLLTDKFGIQWMVDYHPEN